MLPAASRQRWPLSAVLGGLLVLGCLFPPAAPARPSGAAADEAGTAPTPQRVRAAFVAIASSMLPAWIAKDEGLYARYGLEVELAYVSGAAKIAEALLAGELDVGIAPATSAFGPGLEGADTVMLASWANKLGFSALVQPGLQTVADLRGKRVGVSRRGSNSEIWAAAVLGSFGLEPERDYTVLSIGGQSEQLAALQNGAIDVAIMTPPLNLRARQLGFRELLSYRDYSLEFANVGLVSTRRYLREQPAAVDRLLRALAEGTAIMLQQPETALAVLTRYTQVEERDLLEETLAFEQSRTSRDLLPTPAGLRAALDELVATNPKAATATPEAFVALEPIQLLNASGFIASLYR